MPADRTPLPDGEEAGAALIRAHGPLYLVVLAAAVAVFGLLLLKSGANPSTDFATVYEPTANRIALWLQGSGPFPEIAPHQVFHLLYVGLVAAVFALFGAGNLKALVIVQILLSIPVFLAILHVSLRRYRSRWVALGFTLLSLSFLDNLQWVTWAVPDSFFRACFIPAYFWLLALYFGGRRGLFLIALPIATLWLVLIRIDTLFLFLPLFWLALRTVRERIGGRSFWLLLPVLVLPAVALAWGGIEKIWQVYLYWFYHGWVLPGTDQVVPGLTQIEPFDPARAQEIGYLLGRQAKLMALRFWQFFNVYPPFWSTAHQLYYAAYMVPLYLLTIAGLRRAWRERDRYMIVFFYVCLCSLLLHVLTFVDAAKRQTFSVLPFFILFAGYGFDGLCHRYGTSLGIRRRPEKGR